MTNKIKVLTVDDSMLMCRMLQAAFNSESDIVQVAHACDGPEGLEMIGKYRPDVITLDVEMPGMNGLEFLERLMSSSPLPVVMFSSHTAEGTEITLKALELGAVDFLQKPRCGLEKAIEFLKAELLPRVRSGYGSRPRLLRSSLADLRSSRPSNMFESKSAVTPAKSAAVTKAPVTSALRPIKGSGLIDLIAIGSSTGGVAAVRDVLLSWSENMPPIVITQHMPQGYTERFADRLSKQCRMNVKEASDGERLQRGYAYIAPGSAHLLISKESSGYVAHLDAGAPVSGHCPSVDVMFSSVAACAGASAIGVILTGMGRDGADGLLKMRKAGSYTIGQDRESCVVYGMPKAAYEAGAVVEEFPLDKIADAVTDAFSAVQRIGNQSVTGKR